MRERVKVVLIVTEVESGPHIKFVGSVGWQTARTPKGPAVNVVSKVGVYAVRVIPETTVV